jgi:tRNA (cmo5U34)-methyltransferase
MIAEAPNRDTASAQGGAGQAVSLGHLPSGRWEFDEAVTGCFSDMLERSIPQYRVMREACDALAVRHCAPFSAIVDLGCSRGDAIAGLIGRVPESVSFVGAELSEPMLAAARERFAAEIAAGRVRIERTDLREEYPDVRASVTLAVLSLQFTPIEYRHRIIRRAYQGTNTGGALILVEKVIGGSAEIDGVMVETYYGLKSANGYTSDEIARKRHSLEGVLVPVTAAWNEELLRGAGFRQVDCFWRWMNFAGWIAVKD